MSERMYLDEVQKKSAVSRKRTPHVKRKVWRDITVEEHIREVQERNAFLEKKKYQEEMQFRLDLIRTSGLHEHHKEGGL